jgi:hypothetical protein
VGPDRPPAPQLVMIGAVFTDAAKAVEVRLAMSVMVAFPSLEKLPPSVQPNVNPET